MNAVYDDIDEQLAALDAERQDNPRIEPAEIEPFTARRLDFLSDAPRDVVVQRLIEKATVATVAGAPGAGKTGLTVDLALHVAAGVTWFGLKVSGGPVLYVAAEAPGSVTMRALAAARQKFPGQTLPLYLAAVSPLLGDEDHSEIEAARILATAEDVKKQERADVKMIVIDTLASCLGGGDENGDGMVRITNIAQKIAQVTGAAVVLVHHPSKADAAGLRGHGSLLGKCDTVISIEISPDGVTRLATLIKSRDFAAGVQLTYELTPVTLDEPDVFGDPRTTIIVKQIESPRVAQRRPTGKAQELLLTDLERRYRIGETGWDLATIRQAARDLGNSRNIDRLIARLRTGGFLRGGDAHLTLSHPPKDGEP